MLKVTAPALLAIAFTTAKPLSAATLSVPLTPTVKTGADGDYLSANFDFGTEFSHVESVTLEFTMSEGFEGAAVSSGNSFYSRDLAFIIHDGSQTLLDAWAVSSGQGLSQSAFDVPPGTVSSVFFGGLSFPSGEEYQYPDLVLSGQGVIAFIDEFISSSNPLPGSLLGTSTTSWSPPASITNPRLIIVGTPVPEPSTLLLLGFAATSCSLCGVRRRKKSRQ